MLRRHGQLMMTLQIICDLVCTAAAWVAAYPVRFAFLSAEKGKPAFREEFLPLLPLLLIVCLITYTISGLYRPRRLQSLWIEFGQLLKAFTLAFLVFIGIVYFLIGLAPFLPDEHVRSRKLMGVFFLIGVAALSVSRITSRQLLRSIRRRGWNLRYAAIVGTGRTGQSLLHTLRRNAWTGMVVSYFVDEEPGRRQTELYGVPLVGGFERLSQILDARPVDAVFVALSREQGGQLDLVLDGLSRTSADVRLIPDIHAFYRLRPGVSELDGLPIVSLREGPLFGWQVAVKRVFDVVIASIALVVAAVPMLVTAAVIRLTSKGASLYRQRRMGMDGREFTMLKFRTMVEDAEAQTGPVWAGADDPRCTRVGRFLRRTSIDELPQLLNVLSGQMSLVGPRPERPELINDFKHEIPRYMLRHKMKAGMTGWAQAHGLRGQTSLRKRLQYDLYYINNWSLWLDVRILFMTVAGGWVYRQG